MLKQLALIFSFIISLSSFSFDEEGEALDFLTEGSEASCTSLLTRFEGYQKKIFSRSYQLTAYTEWVEFFEENRTVCEHNQLLHEERFKQVRSVLSSPEALHAWADVCLTPKGKKGFFLRTLHQIIEHNGHIQTRPNWISTAPSTTSYGGGNFRNPKITIYTRRKGYPLATKGLYNDILTQATQLKSYATYLMLRKTPWFKEAWEKDSYARPAVETMIRQEAEIYSKIQEYLETGNVNIGELPEKENLWKWKNLDKTIVIFTRFWLPLFYQPLNNYQITQEKWKKYQEGGEELLREHLKDVWEDRLQLKHSVDSYFRTLMIIGAGFVAVNMVSHVTTALRGVDELQDKVEKQIEFMSPESLSQADLVYSTQPGNPIVIKYRNGRIREVAISADGDELTDDEIDFIGKEWATRERTKK